MEAKLSQKNILKLINLYRSHPLLWDMTSKSYRRNDLKTKAYEEIAKEMGMMVEIVKKKIKNLRTTYTNEKRKMNCNKSGSGAEHQYVTSLPWYSEMSFLDDSILMRKTMDNSTEEIFEQMDSFEEIEGFQECFDNEAPRKRPRVATATATSTANATATEKIDEVLGKILEEKENEFTAFGALIAHQLQEMPKEPAYEIMCEIQNIILQKKIQVLRRDRLQIF